MHMLNRSICFLTAVMVSLTSLSLFAAEPAEEFLEALVKIGYDGPVRSEPFNKPLNAMENDPAADSTVKAIRKAIEVAGLGDD